MLLKTKDSGFRSQDSGSRARSQKLRSKKSEARSKILEVEKAISYLEQSVALARKQQMHLELGKSLYELAKVSLPYRETFTVNRETKKAKKCLKAAILIFKKTNAKLWLKKINDLMSQLPNNLITQLPND